MNARSTPRVCNRVDRVPKVPLILSWLISFTYIGTTLKQPPDARPEIILAMMRVVVEE